MTTGKATSQEAVWVSGTLQTGTEGFSIPFFCGTEHGGFGKRKLNNPFPWKYITGHFQRSGSTLDDRTCFSYSRIHLAQWKPSILIISRVLRNVSNNEIGDDTRFRKARDTPEQAIDRVT